MTGPVGAEFNELIHAPKRLQIVSALSAATWVEFSALESITDASTSLLSKNLKVLADAGYVELEKRPQPFGRPRTWVTLTPLGRRAYLAHMAALRDMLGDDLTGNTDDASGRD